MYIYLFIYINFLCFFFRNAVYIINEKTFLKITSVIVVMFTGPQGGHVKELRDSKEILRKV